MSYHPFPSSQHIVTTLRCSRRLSRFGCSSWDPQEALEVCGCHRHVFVCVFLSTHHIGKAARQKTLLASLYVVALLLCGWWQWQ